MEIAEVWYLKIIAIKGTVEYRMRTERIVKAGSFRQPGNQIHGNLRSSLSARSRWLDIICHSGIKCGGWQPDEPSAGRPVHSSTETGDIWDPSSMTTASVTALDRNDLGKKVKGSCCTCGTEKRRTRFSTGWNLTAKRSAGRKCNPGEKGENDPADFGVGSESCGPEYLQGSVRSPITRSAGSVLIGYEAQRSWKICLCRNSYVRVRSKSTNNGINE